jgi:hypothetical protein
MTMALKAFTCTYARIYVCVHMHTYLGVNTHDHGIEGFHGEVFALLLRDKVREELKKYLQEASC